MPYHPKKSWSRAITSRAMEYPAEYLIRIFKGKYPRLNFRAHNLKEKKILDVGCGDGNNLAFLGTCGFKAYGVEITDEIIKKVKKNLSSAGVTADVQIGSNKSLPFNDAFFDYLVSWNACYYMDEARGFKDHVAEFARVLKPGGYLVLSIPKLSNNVLKDGIPLKGGYRIIKNDTNRFRDGAIFKTFRGPGDIEKSFKQCFKNFSFGSIEDDCFGREYHWHLAVCQRK